MPAKGIFAKIHPNPIGTNKRGSNFFLIPKKRINKPTKIIATLPNPSLMEYLLEKIKL